MMNMPLIITKFGNYLRHAFVSRLAFAFWRIFRGNHMQLVFFFININVCIINYVKAAM